jgi:hypothetical protein
MRAWIQTPRARVIALAAVAALAMLTMVLVVMPGLVGNGADPQPVAESPAAATPSPTPSDEPRPTPTSTPTANSSLDPAPAPAEPAPGQPAAPPKPPAPQPIEPGVIGMDVGSFNGCGEFPSGQTVYMSFGWTARQGNTVDVSYALTDTSARASGGFISLGSGLGVTGWVDVPRTCPNGAGPLPYITVKFVANSPTGGSATAYMWGY